MRGILLLALLCAGLARAQDFVGSGFLESSRGGEERKSVSTTSLFSLPAPITNHDGVEVSYWRSRIDASIPAFRAKRWGLNCSARLSYLGINDNAYEMPPRLIRAGTGLSSFFITGRKYPSFLAFFSNVEMRADFDQPQLKDLKFSQGFMASFTLSPKWTLIAGLFYTTEFFQTRIAALRYTPLPIVAFSYKPNDELSLSLSPLNVSLRYKPTKYADLRVAYNVPLALNLSLGHELLPWFTIREFFGHHEETYNLTGERWREYSKIELAGWGTGVQFEFLPFDTVAQALKGSTIRLTYQFGFLQRWRIFTYDDDDTRKLYELGGSHNFALTISIAL